MTIFVIDLCGQLSCTASTPTCLLLSCGYSSSCAYHVTFKIKKKTFLFSIINYLPCQDLNMGLPRSQAAMLAIEQWLLWSCLACIMKERKNKDRKKERKNNHAYLRFFFRMCIFQQIFLSWESSSSHHSSMVSMATCYQGCSGSNLGKGVNLYSFWLKRKFK